MAKRTTMEMTIKIKMVIPGNNTHQDNNWWVNRYKNPIKGDSVETEVSTESCQCNNIGIVKNQKYFLLQSINMHKSLMKQIIKDIPHPSVVVGRIIKPRHDKPGGWFPQIEATFNLGELTAYVLLNVQPATYMLQGQQSHPLKFPHADPNIIDHIFNYCQKAIIEYIEWKKQWGEYKEKV